MAKKRIATMTADDARQYMLSEDFEIYEKFGTPSGAMEMHFHNFYEIMYITEGEFAILVNNTTYRLKPGDFILVNLNQLHHYQYVEQKHETCRRVLMWISKSHLEQLSGPDADLSYCFSLVSSPAWHFPAPQREKLSGYLERLLLLEADGHLNPWEVRLLKNAYLTLFFVSLNQLCRHPDFSFTAKNTCSNLMIRTLTDYINAHIEEPITLDMLAEQAHLSKYHFVRIFKNLTGMTVHDFITHKRMIKACEMIWAGEPLGTLCQLCGFTDYSSFFRNFKAIYGVSPREFKAFYEKDTELP